MGNSAQAGLRRLEKAASAGDGNAADLLRRVVDPADAMTVNGAFVAATGQLLVSVGRAGTETGVHYRLCLGHFFPLVGRSWIEPLALRCIQFPHQLADADARPEMYLADPALHVLVVALPAQAAPGV
jgi:hypothetical protein